ncbi:NAD(P)/FAD-dependent oxidoreductase [Aquidulcibacter sp.]|uniref:NAD(P)/FAD-dependent oxidoreductase n=1 Tax=Aquidulcibacter sp. TaxID=2052990 RepID=UPI0025B9B07A|nr:NAD(P)/FAD-dependent oxidoreductase [Aquidulcibacter sp.]MCA3697338.1 NAD(P)/FAD-dependent oxidoreductase [Aquidulcibacter sp.]
MASKTAGQILDVAIIGAGPAGLTAGYLLTQHGHSVHILEKDETYVGGISRTVNFEGYRFDIGGHRFFSKSREVTELWNEILPDDFIERPRMSRIFYDGKFYSYPLKAFEALTNLGIFRSIHCVLSYMKSRAFPQRDTKTFEQWVVNAFGEKLFSIFFKTYTEKVWGMPCNEISADWAAQRIKGLSLSTAIFDALKRSFSFGKRVENDGMAVKSLLENFRYPRLGPGMMWDAARDKFLAQGGTLSMGQTLKTMRRDEAQDFWIVTSQSADGSVETVRARHVISSAPIPQLVASISPAPPAITNAAQLRFRDFVTVALMVRSEDLFPDNWIYIHDPKVKVGRIQNFRSWSPEMVPDADMACVGLEYFCFEGDGLWSAKDEELVELAKKELAYLGLASPEMVTGGCVVRQEKAYPVYDDAYKAHVEAVRTSLDERYPNLHLVGRNGMHKYNNQDHAMMTAMLTVKNIQAGEKIYDIWNVNEDAEYHESGTEGEQAALASERLVPRRVADAA